MTQVIAAGVISSLLSLVIAALALSWGRKVLLPWYEDTQYQGVRLEGEWKIVSATAQEAVLELRQKANRLTGTCLFMAKYGGDFETTRNFSIDGLVVDRLVRLSFDHLDRSRIGFGSFILEVVKDARTMTGFQVMYSVASDEIVSAACVAVRPGVAVSGADIAALRSPWGVPREIGEEQLQLSSRDAADPPSEKFEQERKSQS